MNRRMLDVAAKVYELVTQIPVGSVTTYKALAHRCNTRAYRAIGQIVGANPRIPEVPCHRVVHRDVRIGGYARGVSEKQKLLRIEGIECSDGRIVDLQRILTDLSHLHTSDES